MSDSVEKPVMQALARIEQALCILNEALVALRQSSVVLLHEITQEQIDRIRDRVETAHAEFRTLYSEHKHVELIDGGNQKPIKPILLSRLAVEAMAHRKKLAAQMDALKKVHAPMGGLQQTDATLQLLEPGKDFFVQTVRFHAGDDSAPPHAPVASGE